MLLLAPSGETIFLNPPLTTELVRASLPLLSTVWPVTSMSTLLNPYVVPVALVALGLPVLP